MHIKLNPLNAFVCVIAPILLSGAFFSWLAIGQTELAQSLHKPIIAQLYQFLMAGLLLFTAFQCAQAYRIFLKPVSRNWFFIALLIWMFISLIWPSSADERIQSAAGLAVATVFGLYLTAFSAHQISRILLLCISGLTITVLTSWVCTSYYLDDFWYGGIFSSPNLLGLVTV